MNVCTRFFICLLSNIQPLPYLNHDNHSSILHAGKDSSCITTVLLLAKTMMFKSCCFSWVSWYHSLITSVSWVGISVTYQYDMQSHLMPGNINLHTIYIYISVVKSTDRDTIRYWNFKNVHFPLRFERC